MTVYAIIDTKKGRTGIAPATYLQTTQNLGASGFGIWEYIKVIQTLLSGFDGVRFVIKTWGLYKLELL